MRTHPFLLLVLVASGCLGHIPMHTTEHLAIGWRADYERAQAEAAVTHKPLMVVLAAGEKDGATCLGADYLRSDGLRDARVIELANAAYTPVWINVRTTALPAWPFLADILVTAKLDAQRNVVDRWSRTFFVHTILVSPDGQTLLNPGAKTVSQTAKALVIDGNFSYEALYAGELLGVLRRGLERLSDLEASYAAR
ncbi:MAG: hypothetical protein ABI321_24640 [Polyangia bacterium]